MQRPDAGPGHALGRKLAELGVLADRDWFPSVEGGSLFWRLLVVAEEGSDFTLVEEVA